jgi:hypothetical protein
MFAEEEGDEGIVIELKSDAPDGLLGQVVLPKRKVGLVVH